MQALYLGNGYAKRLGEALKVHFDRYESNETQTFEYVADLNVIGNLFDDDGVDAIAEALDHPFSYTESLLLGRNRRIGDKAATRIATLIASPKRKTGSNLNPDVAGKYLNWLEIGGTAMTASGIAELYRAMGTRSFSFLGLESTRRHINFLLPDYFNDLTSPIPESLKHLHEAKYLQSLSLNGNRLGDAHMSILAEGATRTDIKDLTLVNNKIGSRGIEHIAPLTKHLKSLSLGINEGIGDGGAEILADALKEPDATLETLSMFRCRIGQSGAQALLSIFPGNTKLKYLILKLGSEDSDIDESVIQALEQATEANWHM